MAVQTFNDAIEKFNPYHDRLGRFSSASGAASFTYSPGKSKAHDMAIAREKERYEQDRAKKKEKGQFLRNAIADTVYLEAYDSIPDDLADIKEVNRIAGKTYKHKEKLKAAGFVYEDEAWIRPDVVRSDGGLYISRNGNLPSDTSRIKYITGDTKSHKDQIKAAGFYWDGYYSRSWLKSESRSNTTHSS